MIRLSHLRPLFLATAFVLPASAVAQGTSTPAAAATGAAAPAAKGAAAPAKGTEPAATAAPAAKEAKAAKPTPAKDAKAGTKTTTPAKDPKGKETKSMNANAVQVTMTTSMGTIKIELDKEKAPKSVENFVNYAKAGQYNKTIFHRVIDGFMIQGGGFDEKMTQKPVKAPIANEASNGLKNARGSIAMARTSDPNSATSQFFINLVNNDALNYSPMSAGYAVFGKVVEGMDVVDQIAKVKTGDQGMHSNVPVKAVVIESVTVNQ